MGIENKTNLNDFSWNSGLQIKNSGARNSLEPLPQIVPMAMAYNGKWSKNGRKKVFQKIILSLF